MQNVMQALYLTRNARGLPASARRYNELYVEPSKKNAHIIVPEGGKNLIALEMIINRIQRHIDASAD
jgi:uridine kinase